MMPCRHLVANVAAPWRWRTFSCCCHIQWFRGRAGSCTRVCTYYV